MLTVHTPCFQRPGINIRDLLLAFENSIPSYTDNIGFVNQLSPAIEDAEEYNPFYIDTEWPQLVVMSIPVGRPCFRHINVRNDIWWSRFHNYTEGIHHFTTCRRSNGHQVVGWLIMIEYGIHDISGTQSGWRTPLIIVTGAKDT